MKTYQNYINGKWMDSLSKEKIQVDDGWLFYYGTDQRTTWSGEVFYHKCEIFK